VKADSASDDRTWPKVSIVTPSYNQGAFIEETIRSVLLQQYPNLEYIIIDGGSSDETVEILEKYDPWIDYWISEPDAGQSHALNKGFRRATGEVLAYINSDDYYLERAVRRVVTSFLNTDADVIAGSIVKVPEQEFVEPVVHNNLFEWILSSNSSISQPGSFWRRSVSPPAFDESLRCVFDRKFFMELMDRGAIFHTLPDVLTAFRIHESSKTETLQKTFFLENIALNKQMLLGLDDPEQDIALRKIEFEEARFKLHSATKLKTKDIRSVVSAVMREPRLLLKRELYGRIRRMTTK
jgi:glycosyltransferase involved in cell wall biosynthesis